MRQARAATLRRIAILLSAMGFMTGFLRADDDSSQRGIRKKIFDKATFGGNGRVCSTCHIGQTGTFNPEQAQALFNRDPNNLLFRSIDSDDGVGTNFNRLLNHATVRIPLALPANAEILGEPGNQTAVVVRGTPSTNRGIREFSNGGRTFRGSQDSGRCSRNNSLPAGVFTKRRANVGSEGVSRNAVH
jgi:hypothetical protein